MPNFIGFAQHFAEGTESVAKALLGSNKQDISHNTIVKIHIFDGRRFSPKKWRTSKYQLYAGDNS